MIYSLYGQVFGLDAPIGLSIIVQTVNVLFLVTIAFGIIFLLRFLSKVNKALDIWLEKNSKK